MLPVSNKTWRPEWTAEFLSRPIPPVAVPLTYRLGLAGVALTLLLLQASYVGLVILTGWLTWKYLLLIPAIFAVIKIHLVTIVLVLAPFLAGLTATFFLLKPLLSRPPKAENLMELRREDEPEFFRFVDRLCEMVGSPAPTTIAVDLQVNAFAALNRGWFSLVRGDLMLTVGLPLVEGFTLRQFSGVLAHEFGHFSQKAGLRLHFLIAHSRIWFARVAFERDGWDERVEEFYEGGNWQVKTIAGLAMLCVIATRWILKQLLRAADFVSASFSRQMEFHADLHEAGLVGEEVFRQTTMRLVEMNHSLARCWKSIDQTWEDGRLPDNVPALAGVIDQTAAGLDRAAVAEAVLAEETEPLATHPAARDRIANVAGHAGVVPAAGPWGEDLPASILFRDFSTICIAASRAHYQRTLDEHLEKATVEPVARYAPAQTSYWNAQDNLRLLFGGCTKPGRWFQLNTEVAEPLVLLSGDMGDDEYWDNLRMWLNQSAGLHLMRSGTRIEAQTFQLEGNEMGPAMDAVQLSYAALVRSMRALSDRYRANGPILNGDAEMVAAYQALSAQQLPLLDLRRAFNDNETLVMNLEHIPEDRREAVHQKIIDEMARLTREIHGELSQNAWLAERLPKAEAAMLLNGTDALADELLGSLITQMKSTD